MDTTQKKVAKHLARALIELDLADWDARDWKQMNKYIRTVRASVSNLFTSTGYEFAENPLRVRIRKA